MIFLWLSYGLSKCFFIVRLIIWWEFFQEAIVVITAECLRAHSNEIKKKVNYNWCEKVNSYFILAHNVMSYKKLFKDVLCKVIHLICTFD